jgi:hypothetical protein
MQKVNKKYEVKKTITNQYFTKYRTLLYFFLTYCKRYRNFAWMNIRNIINIINAIIYSQKTSYYI